MKSIENIVALIIVSVFALTGYSVLQSEPATPPQAKTNYELHFLDVGQGDAILLESGANQLLIDGGPDSKILEKLGRVMPVNDRTIEAVVLTHPHADHLRGLNIVLRNYRAGKVYFSGVSHNTPEFTQFLGSIKERGVATERLYKGKNITFEEVKVDTLWPPQNLENINDLNDSSVALQLEYLQNKALLLGDIAVASQKNILPILASVDILKVSHHGSNTGTSEELLNITRPKYAVIMVGKNSYGHPTPTVLSLLRGSKILRTDILGTISFGINKEGVFLY